MSVAAMKTREETTVRRAVVTLCAVVFIADIVFGIVTPTFSLFARDLGISVALLGAINTTGSLAQLFVALPAGALSDRVSRPRMIATGMAIYGAALASLTFAHGPALLAVGRVIMALATVAIFQVGAAYLGDVTVTGQREIAYGWMATAMGLGFTVGPLVGSQIAQHAGTRAAYAVGAAIALSGGAVAWRFLHEPPHGAHTTPTRAPFRAGMRQVIRQRDVLIVSLGNLLMGLAFNGAISTFFPIYADHVALSEATIGVIFAIRALVSAASRFPNSMLARRVGGRPILLIALFLEVVVMFGIAMTGQRVLLTLLLAAEGLAFGAYLVAGQTYIAERTTRETRGAAYGFYSTASNLGGTAAPVLLGLIAHRWGITAVFPVAGSAIGAGFVICSIGMLVLQRERRTETD